MRHARNLGVFYLLLGAAVSAAIYLRYSSTALFPDEGSFCTIAQGILRGELPYRDYFNEKGPLHYFLTALIMKLFYPGIEGGRLTSSILLAASLALFFRTIHRSIPGTLVSLFWVMAIVLGGVGMGVYNNTAESSLALCAIIASISLLNGGSGSSRQAMIAGLIHGLACGFRQTMLVPALLLLLWPWEGKGRRDYLLALIAGAGLWLVPLIYLGLWDDFLSSCILFHIGNPHLPRYFRDPFWADSPLIWTWLFAGAASFIVALRGERKHLHYVLWALSLALPFAGRMDAFRLWPSFLAFSVFLVIYGSAPRTFTRHIPLLFILLSVNGILRQDRLHPYDMHKKVAEKVRSLSRPEDPIWAAPFSPQVYCMADRPSVSRYYFILPWTIKEEVLTRLGKDLETHPPKIMVTGPGWEAAKKLLPALGPDLEQNYSLAAQVGTVRIYKLTENSP